MQPNRYEPWRPVRQLWHELDRVFAVDPAADPADTSDWIPPVDLQEEKNRYVLRADVPGVAPDAIEIIAENGVLTIRGQRPGPSAEARAGYRRVERPCGGFYRRFALPNAADSTQITARSAHGVLEIVIPKASHTLSRTIQVQG